MWGYDSVSNPSPRTDGNGHGTHVAGMANNVYSNPYQHSFHDLMLIVIVTNYYLLYDNSVVSISHMTMIS